MKFIKLAVSILLGLAIFCFCFILEENGGEVTARQQIEQSERSIPTEKLDPTPKPIKVLGSPRATIADMVLTDTEIKAKPENVGEDVWREIVFRHRIRVENENGTLDFKGKVVDQDGVPVEGAKICGLCKIFVESLQYQVSKLGLQVIDREIIRYSNSNGNFSFSGIRARTLNILSITKEGFLDEAYSKTYNFSPSFPETIKYMGASDSSDVFVMFSQDKTEPLSKKSWLKRISADGTNFAFDLEGGEFHDNPLSGDLIVSVDAEYGPRSKMINYPWRIEVGLVDGGILVAKDERSNLAPKEGYLKTLEWRSLSQEDRWESDFEKRIYVKGPEGRFFASVVLHLQVLPNNRGRIRLETLVNPKGSRILRFNPALEIKSE